MAKNGFVLRIGEKRAILGGSETALFKFTHEFLPQFFGYGIMPGGITLFYQSLYSEIFIKRYLFGKVTILLKNQ